MPTFLGWTVINMPTDPAAPATAEFMANDAVAISISPFTGQQQVQNWGALPMEVSITLPPLKPAQIDAWITFLRSLQGQANVFQFSAAFMGAYASSIGTRYWRLKTNQRKWSVDRARLFGITFEAREAK